MASRTGTLVGVEVLRGNDDAYPAETTGAIKRGVVTLWNNTASTVIGGTDTLDLATLGASIASALGTGKTCTIRSVALYGCAVVAGTSYAATCAMSSTTLQLSPTAVSDFSTNATLPANTSTTQRYYQVFVTWSEA